MLVWEEHLVEVAGRLSRPIGVAVAGQTSVVTVPAGAEVDGTVPAEAEAGVTVPAEAEVLSALAEAEGATADAVALE